MKSGIVKRGRGLSRVGELSAKTGIPYQTLWAAFNRPEVRITEATANALSAVVGCAASRVPAWIEKNRNKYVKK